MLQDARSASTGIARVCGCQHHPHSRNMRITNGRPYLRHALINASRSVSLEEASVDPRPLAGADIIGYVRFPVSFLLLLLLLPVISMDVTAAKRLEMPLRHSKVTLLVPARRFSLAGGVHEQQRLLPNSKYMKLISKIWLNFASKFGRLCEGGSKNCAFCVWVCVWVCSNQRIVVNSPPGRQHHQPGRIHLQQGCSK